MNITFDHIAIPSTDIARDALFYHEHFSNSEILYQDESWAFLRIGDLKLALVSPDQHPSHLAFRVQTHAELENLANVYEKTIKVHRDRSESFYLSDPSGNANEIVWYPEKS